MELAHSVNTCIFQTSQSAQSRAIQLATGSKYSHMGIIYKQDNQVFVYEAIQPVQLTPLNEWIQRGEKEYYVVKRVKNAKQLLTADNLAKLQQAGRKYEGKAYDLYFEWSDDRIYCSELVWKMYKEALGLEVGSPEPLGDFDLTHPAVKQKLKERYGEHIPQKEQVVSPAAIFQSELLTTVFKN